MKLALRAFAGVSCAVEITGLGLAQTNAVRVITAGLCGDSAADAPEASYGDFQSTAVVSNNGTYRTYQLGTATNGFATSSLTVCWGHSPISAENYSVRIGDFTLTGPGATALPGHGERGKRS